MNPNRDKLPTNLYTKQVSNAWTRGMLVHNNILLLQHKRETWLGKSPSRREYSMLSTSISKSNHTINSIHIHSYAPVRCSQYVSKWLHMQYVCSKIFIVFGGEILVRPVTRHSTRQANFQHKTGELAPNFSTLLEVQRSLLTVHCSMHRKLQTLPTIVNSVAWHGSSGEESVSSQVITYGQNYLLNVAQNWHTQCLLPALICTSH